MDKVFVYGSLKEGFYNHDVLGDSELLGLFTTEPNYTMFDLGSYPGVMKGGSTAILGEVYKITPETLERLDYLEGYPGYYDRCVVDTKFGEAYLYHISAVDVEAAHDVMIVPAGEWNNDNEN